MTQNKHYVTAHLMGGMGNQMFQSTMAYTYGKDHNLEPIFSLTCDQNQTRKISYTENVLRKLTRRDLGNISWNVIREQVHYYQPLPSPPPPGNVYLYGFFQSDKFFKHRKTEIRELFAPSNEIIIHIDKLNMPEGSVSIHIRRGDYLVISQDYVQPISYYQAALTELAKLTNLAEKTFYVFSDDIEWCKKQDIFLNLKSVFVEEPDYICLYMMARCQYHINANSTFSWWGAYISNSKKVFCPERRFSSSGPVWKIEDEYPQDDVWTVIPEKIHLI